MTNYTLRQELLEYIRNLKDRDYQENCWVKNNCPPNVEYDELKLTINFLFDDTVFAENPEYYLGAELQDKGEVSAVADVCRELRAYSGEDDRHFRGNVTDGFNLPHWKLKRNVSGHDQSTFSVFS